MVDELSQSLAAEGCDVYVISPYYNYNRYGEVDYLKTEGIQWHMNVGTFIGDHYCDVGCHRGEEHGVRLHFLHHFDYWAAPYCGGSPVHQLESIVLFAKASLELLCQLHVQPGVLITNDWFTGLLPAYARKSGAFGSFFMSTTCFHLIHNLEKRHISHRTFELHDNFRYITFKAKKQSINRWWHMHECRNQEAVS